MKKIYSLLGWENIKNNLLNNNEKVDVFEILYAYFKKEGISLPPIVNIYKNYIKQNEIKYYREKEIRNIISEEMILNLISYRYFKNIIEDNKKDYFYFESYKDEKDNSPLKFNMVWDLNPQIKIKFKDYMKRDVRQALEWIFDSNRIKREGKIKGKGDLQKCLDICLSSYNIIINHYILKSKCPKPTSIRKDNILNEDNIKDIVNVLRWGQKELLYFICNIEADIIFLLYQIFNDNEISNLENKYINEIASKNGNDKIKEMEGKGYFSFSFLVYAYNNNIEKIRKIRLDKDSRNKKENNEHRSFINNRTFDHRLRIIRNMLAHGRLYEDNISYSEVISVLDDSLKAIFDKNLKCYYINKNKVNK